MRLVPPQMEAMRRGLMKSGLSCTTDPDEAFFVGRNPS
jgi:hypothetical protein